MRTLVLSQSFGPDKPPSQAPAAGRSQRRAKRLVVVAVVALAATSAVRASVYLNLSRSLPIGLYRRIGGAPGRGDVVVACLPAPVGQFARARGYLWRGDCPGGAAPVGKRVLAVAGDTVAITYAGFVVNGTPVPNSRIVARDSRRRPLPHHPFGRYAVGAGEVWLFSPYHALSFDSRYFGPVRTRDILARIRPLWVTITR